MAYLIVMCEELGDQFECDADRTPMFMCDSWKDLNLDYLFEVYELKADNTFECVKDYEEPLEKGMALYWWDVNDNLEKVKPNIIEKWENRTRNNKEPKMIKQILKNLKADNIEIDNQLKYCGYISWYDECENYWVYGEYNDNNFNLGY